MWQVSGLGRDPELLPVIRGWAKEASVLRQSLSLDPWWCGWGMVGTAPHRKVEPRSPAAFHHVLVLQRASPFSNLPPTTSL